MNEAADHVVDLYRRHAEAWTAARGTQLAEGAWLERFAALLAPGAHVLDVGCGSGVPIAHYLREHGLHVTGVDASPEMVAMFRENLPGATAHVADMRSLHLGQRFSGLLVWDSMFHLGRADQRAMFPILREHAKTGAALMFTSGPSAGESIGILEGEPLFHASLDPHDYRTLLDQHGFDVVSHVAQDPDCGGHTVWLAQQR